MNDTSGDGTARTPAAETKTALWMQSLNHTVELREMKFNETEINIRLGGYNRKT